MFNELNVITFLCLNDVIILPEMVVKEISKEISRDYEFQKFLGHMAQR